MRGLGRVAPDPRHGHPRGHVGVRLARIGRRGDVVPLVWLRVVHDHRDGAGLPALGDAELALLLDLLSQALANEPNAAGKMEAVSEDGTLFIQVAAPNSAAADAVVVTQPGTLRGPDYTLTISDVNDMRAVRTKRIGAS